MIVGTLLLFLISWKLTLVMLSVGTLPISIVDEYSLSYYFHTWWCLYAIFLTEHLTLAIASCINSFFFLLKVPAVAIGAVCYGKFLKRVSEGYQKALASSGTRRQIICVFDFLSLITLLLWAVLYNSPSFWFEKGRWRTKASVIFGPSAAFTANPKRNPGNGFFWRLTIRWKA